jgi:hypothetical protein
LLCGPKSVARGCTRGSKVVWVGAQADKRAAAATATKRAFFTFLA